MNNQKGIDEEKDDANNDINLNVEQKNIPIDNNEDKTNIKDNILSNKDDDDNFSLINNKINSNNNNKSFIGDYIKKIKNNDKKVDKNFDFNFNNNNSNNNDNNQYYDINQGKFQAICPYCFNNAYLKVNPNNVSLNLCCESGHKIYNLSLNDYIYTLNNFQDVINCKNCKSKISSDFMFCTCGNYYCQKCTKIHISENNNNKYHNLIGLIHQNNYCKEHMEKKLIGFCKTCDKNLCGNCISLSKNQINDNKGNAQDNSKEKNKDKINDNNNDKKEEEFIYFHDNHDMFYYENIEPAQKELDDIRYHIDLEKAELDKVMNIINKWLIQLHNNIVYFKSLCSKRINLNIDILDEYLRNQRNGTLNYSRIINLRNIKRYLFKDQFFPILTLDEKDDFCYKGLNILNTINEIIGQNVISNKRTIELFKDNRNNIDKNKFIRDIRKESADNKNVDGNKNNENNNNNKYEIKDVKLKFDYESLLSSMNNIDFNIEINNDLDKMDIKLDDNKNLNNDPNNKQINNNAILRIQTLSHLQKTKYHFNKSNDKKENDAISGFSLIDNVNDEIEFDIKDEECIENYDGYFEDIEIILENFKVVEEFKQMSDIQDFYIMKNRDLIIISTSKISKIFDYKSKKFIYEMNDRKNEASTQLNQFINNNANNKYKIRKLSNDDSYLIELYGNGIINIYETNFKGNISCKLIQSLDTSVNYKVNGTTRKKNYIQDFVVLNSCYFATVNDTQIEFYTYNLKAKLFKKKTYINATVNKLFKVSAYTLMGYLDTSENTEIIFIDTLNIKKIAKLKMNYRIYSVSKFNKNIIVLGHFGRVTLLDEAKKEIIMNFSLPDRFVVNMSLIKENELFVVNHNRTKNYFITQLSISNNGAIENKYEININNNIQKINYYKEGALLVLGNNTIKIWK